MVLPSQFPEFEKYPTVGSFVAKNLDMQFDDVRSMMKLPIPKAGLTAGCNFAAAAALCNLVSGISVVLYTPEAPNNGRGKRFKALLEDFYPWDPGETKKDKEDKAKVIYDLVRNPLAHSLGAMEEGSLPIFIAKNVLTEAQLVQIETPNARPNWVPLAVKGDSTKYTLYVPGLYWGVFRLTWRLAKNANQMQKAETRMAKEALSNG